MKLAPVALVSLVFSCSAFGQTASLTYIHCKFLTFGIPGGVVMNYYIDESGKRLLNDSKVEFGRTTLSNNETIEVTMRGSKGATVWSINRLTGQVVSYDEGKRLETLQAGDCVKATPPKRKF